MSPPIRESYPDPSQWDEELYKRLLELPGDQKVDLNLLRSHVWDQVETFSIPKERVIRGMQANMFAIKMEDKDKEVRNVIVKRIVPAELPEKPSDIAWASFLRSVRAEMEYYRSLLQPENEPIRCLFPQVYHSSGTSKEKDSTPKRASFAMIMDDLSGSYLQKPAMNRQEARCVMDSLARLHSHYWGKMEGIERGTFWQLKLRKELGEMEKGEKTWSNFVDRFPELEVEQEQVRRFGSLLIRRAEELETIVEKGAVTRVHGDAKGWNFFSKKSEGANLKNKTTPPFLLIDMQWTGRGHPLQDVAYALTTSLEAGCLDDMDGLVDYYVDTLGDMLEMRGVEMDRKKMRQEYDLVWLDYARVIISGLWGRLDKESIIKNRNKVGPSMINRSWDHVLFIVKRMAKLLL